MATPILNKTRFILAVLLCCVACCSHQSGKSPPRAVKGVLDLRDWDFQKDGPVRLEGEWEFFWDRLVGPEAADSIERHNDPAYAPVPAAWHEISWHGKRLPGKGVATCRLKILLPDTAISSGLEMQQVISAYRVYWNRRLLTREGVLDSNWKMCRMTYMPKAVTIPATGDSAILTVQVACNYDRGGLWPALTVGDEASVFAGRHSAIALRSLILGCILMLALFHLFFFLFRFADIAYLYFACLCFAFAGFLSVFGENIFASLFPGTPFVVYIAVYNVCGVLCLPLIFMFGRRLFPKEFSRRIVVALQALTCVILPTLFFPSLALSGPISLVNSLVGITFPVYGFYCVVLITVRRRDGAKILLPGFVLLAVAAVNDTLLNMFLIRSVILLPSAVLAMLVCQTIALARHFNRTQSDLVKHREALAHAEKLAAIGTLVAGVAHEINNPNAAIRLNTDLLQKSWGKLEPVLDEYAQGHHDFEIGNMSHAEFKKAVAESLDSTGRNVDRIRTLVDDLRTFARKDEGRLDEVVDVNAVVKDAISILGVSLRKATNRLEVSYAPEDPRIKGNAMRLEQVVVNLLNNARQALTEGNQRIYVSTAFDQARHGVIITVRDEGRGMDAKTLERIKEPFFTTKGPGEGTGLGLLICDQIVKKHGGEMNIESEPGKGTTVSVLLPVAGAKNGSV